METSFSFWVLWRKKQRWERSCSRLQNGFCFFSVSSDLFWYTIITAYNYWRERYSFSSSEMARKEMLKPQGRGQRTLCIQLQSSLHPLPGKQIIRWAIRAQINHHLTHRITVLGARHGRGTSMEDKCLRVFRKRQDFGFSFALPAESQVSNKYLKFWSASFQL